MKATTWHDPTGHSRSASRLLPLLLALFTAPLSLPADQYGDFTYSSDGSSIIIGNYTGPGGDVIVPDSINGLPVTCIWAWAFLESPLTGIIVPDTLSAIGDDAFSGCTNLAGINLPNTLTNLGEAAFARCNSLTNITLGTRLPRIKFATFYDCRSLTNVTIPDSAVAIDMSAFYLCTNLISASIGRSVTNIGASAFGGCSNLVTMTLGKNLARLESLAFSGCPGLATAWFQGNAPSLGANVFGSDTNATVYYLPKTTGWGPTFGGRPAILWNPGFQASDPSFGPGPNGFGLPVTGTPDIPIVLEASEAVAGADWLPLQSCTLTNGSVCFSDPDWTARQARFYRIRSP